MPAGNLRDKRCAEELVCPVAMGLRVDSLRLHLGGYPQLVVSLQVKNVSSTHTEHCEVKLALRTVNKMAQKMPVHEKIDTSPARFHAKNFHDRAF